MQTIWLFRLIISGSVARRRRGCQDERPRRTLKRGKRGEGKRGEEIANCKLQIENCKLKTRRHDPSIPKTRRIFNFQFAISPLLPFTLSPRLLPTTRAGHKFRPSAPYLEEMLEFLQCDGAPIQTTYRFYPYSSCCLIPVSRRLFALEPHPWAMPRKTGSPRILGEGFVVQAARLHFYHAGEPPAPRISTTFAESRKTEILSHDEKNSWFSVGFDNGSELGGSAAGCGLPAAAMGTAARWAMGPTAAMGTTAALGTPAAMGRRAAAAMGTAAGLCCACTLSAFSVAATGLYTNLTAPEFSAVLSAADLSDMLPAPDLTDMLPGSGLSARAAGPAVSEPASGSGENA